MKKKINLGTKGIQQKSYKRLDQSLHQSSILIYAQDRLISDIELLLEDKWKDLRLVSEESDIDKLLSTGNKGRMWIPSGFMVHISTEQDLQKSFQLLEVKFKNTPFKSILLSESCPSSLEKMVNRRASILSVGVLKLPSDMNLAAREVEDFMFSVLERGLVSNELTVQRLTAASQGFIAGIIQRGGTWDESKSETLIQCARFLMSKFVMNTETISAAEALAGMYDFWKAFHSLKSPPQSIINDFATLEQTLDKSDVPIKSLLVIAAKVRDFARRGGMISEDQWKQSISDSELGTLAKRQFLELHPKLVSFVNRVEEQEKEKLAM